MFATRVLGTNIRYRKTRRSVAEDLQWGERLVRAYPSAQRFKLKDYTVVSFPGKYTSELVVLESARVIALFQLELAEPKIITPHATLDADFRRKGLTTLVYKYFLDKGYVFLSGEDQTAEANLVWKSLSSSYAWKLVVLDDGQDFKPYNQERVTRRDVRVLMGKPKSLERAYKKLLES